MNNIPAEQHGEVQVVETEEIPMVIDPMENEKSVATIDSQIANLIPTAGMVALTDEEKSKLYAPVNQKDVEIRPDGLVYLPWMEYLMRLKSVFGMEWAMIPHGQPKLEDNRIYWGFYLIIRGHLAGYSIGEQEYQASNRTMSYGDAIEGAKSNALMRLCKGIGISLELWKPSFVKEWKSKHAESYHDTRRNRTLWRKKSVGTANSKNYELKTDTVKVKDFVQDLPSTPEDLDAEWSKMETKHAKPKEPVKKKKTMSLDDLRKALSEWEAEARNLGVDEDEFWQDITVSEWKGKMYRKNKSQAEEFIQKKKQADETNKAWGATKAWYENAKQYMEALRKG